MTDPEYTNIDLETFFPDQKFYNWQKDIIGGFKKGEMAIMASGRNTGKSTLTMGALKKLIDDMEKLDPNFEVLTSGTVDGAPWYTIACKKDVSIWIRENGAENSEWVDYVDSRWMYHRNKLDVSQEMLAMIKLRWGT